MADGNTTEMAAAMVDEDRNGKWPTAVAMGGGNGDGDGAGNSI